MREHRRSLLALFALLWLEAAPADSVIDSMSTQSSPVLILRQETGGQWEDFRAGQKASSTVEVGDSSRVTRISKKLAIGALWGVVPSYFSGMFLTLAAGNTEGFGAGLVLQFTVALGYPMGVAAGVSRVDPHDRFIHSLAGSGVGLLANFYIPIPYQFSAFDWDVIWNWFVCPLVGATVASELGRHPDESRRSSIDVVPSPGALSAAARWRF